MPHSAAPLLINMYINIWSATVSARRPNKGLTQPLPSAAAWAGRCGVCLRYAVLKGVGSVFSFKRQLFFMQTAASNRCLASALAALSYPQHALASYCCCLRHCYCCCCCLFFSVFVCVSGSWICKLLLLHIVQRQQQQQQPQRQLQL